jgi:hypothetical protein
MTAKAQGHDDEGTRAALAASSSVRFDDLAGPEREALLARALDYRGDVTLALSDGTSVSGYLFAVDAASARLYPDIPGAGRVSIPLAKVVGCAFTGADKANGRSWEAWAKRYEERKRRLAAGLDAPDIEPQPESLD